MSSTRRRSFIWIAVVALALTACPRRQAPQIWSIAGTPRIAKEGGAVTYTVRYHNSSQEDSFHDAVLTLSYDRYLRYTGEVAPRPDDADTSQRAIRWDLGDMGPGEEGAVEVVFLLASNIPRATYELEVTARIVSVDAEGETVSRSESAVTLIEGHPTPTPTPTSTPTSTPIYTPASTATATRALSTAQPAATPTPALGREDCLAYDPKALAIADAAERGWYLMGAKGRQMLLLDDKDDAYAALALAQRHTAHCFIGRGNTRPNRLEYIVDYWEGASGTRTTILNEDCLPYDPGALRIVDEGKTGWLLTDGRTRMLVLDSEQDAQAALALAQGHEAHCFIGRGNDRPDPAAYIVHYWQ